MNNGQGASVEYTDDFVGRMDDGQGASMRYTDDFIDEMDNDVLEIEKENLTLISRFSEKKRCELVGGRTHLFYCFID